jgi:hypothetical protein
MNDWGMRWLFVFFAFLSISTEMRWDERLCKAR